MSGPRNRWTIRLTTRLVSRLTGGWWQLWRATW